MAKQNQGLKTVGPGEPSLQDPSARYLMPTTEQQDYERRRTEEAIANGEDLEPHPLSVDHTKPRDFAVEGNDTSNYVGVDPEYRTYARETEAPMRADGGPVEQAEKRLLANENFPVAAPAGPPEGNQIVGTGSTVQTVLPGTSGSAVSGYVVEQTEPANEDEGDESPKVSVEPGNTEGPTPPPSPGT